MNLFQLIKNKVDLWTVVSRYVQIKRAGGYWKGPCPFHSETDASFTISPEKKIFYCFGCHESGDVLDFFSKVENIPPIEAAVALANEFSIEIPQSILNETQNNSSKKDSLVKACTVFSEWTANCLKNNRQALKYLHEDRKLNPQTIERFKIGFFPDAHQTQLFLDFALEQNVLLQDLVSAGIFSQQGQDLWSPFFNRIIFPIRNWQGKTIAFGARVMPESDAKPKYYNSKESEIFHKGESFFGIDLARPNIKRDDFCVIVEGYFDCVLMHQQGFNQTLATLGTAFGSGHFKALSNLSKKVFLIYDGDKAGLNAMLKVAKASFEHDIELLILTLPNNEDPASCVTKGIEIDLGKAQGIFKFFARALSEDFYKKSVSERLVLINELVEVIRSISDLAKREVLILEAACQLQIPTTSLRSQAQKQLLQTAAGQIKQSKEVGQINESIGLQIFCIFLNAHKAGAGQDMLPENFKELLIIENDEICLNLLTQFLQYCYAQCPGDCLSQLIANLPLELQNFICKCMIKYDGKNGLESFNRLVEKLKADSFKKNIGQLRNSITSDEKNAFDILREVVKKVKGFKG